MRIFKLMTIAAALVLLLPAAGALAGSPTLELVPDEETYEVDEEKTIEVEISDIDEFGGFYVEADYDSDMVQMDISAGDVYDGYSTITIDEPLDVNDREGYAIFTDGELIGSPEGVMAEIEFTGRELGEIPVGLEFHIVTDDENEDEVEPITKKFQLDITSVGDVPEISLDKSVSPTSAEPGDTIEYTFDIENTGNISLEDVQLEDDLLDETWDPDDLGEGDSEQVTAEHSIPDDFEGEKENTATVTAVFNDEQVEDTATATVDVEEDPDPDPPAPTPDPEYTVTVEVEGEGEVEPEPGDYTHDEDEEITLEATPADGWVFDDWLIDGEPAEVEEPELDHEVTSDVTITAEFVEAPVILPYTSEFMTPEDGGELNVEDTYNLVLPPNAFEEDAEIGVTVETATEDICPPDGPADGQVFTLSATSIDDNEELHEFAEMAEVTLHYDEDELEVEPEELAVHYYHEDLDLWIPVPSELDAEEGTLEAEVDRVTQLAVCVPEEEFSDAVGHWAERDILKLHTVGAVSGYPDGTFQPEAEVTREEFITMLVQTAGLETPEVVRMLPQLIEDADDISDWAAPAVEVALTERIIEGYEDDTFRPDRDINRAEIATMVVDALELAPPAEVELEFVDEIPEWAQGYVARAEETGIITGFPDDTFRAIDSATRAETATMLVRYLGQMGGE